MSENTKSDAPTLSVILRRALRLRCPRCGGGKLFSGWFRMYDDCPNCKLQYERDPGYFLGSTYINYGLTTLVMTIAYVTLHFAVGLENNVLVVPLLMFCVLFPTLFFRHARSFWLAFDCFFDASGREEQDQ